MKKGIPDGESKLTSATEGKWDQYTVVLRVPGPEAEPEPEPEQDKIGQAKSERWTVFVGDKRTRWKDCVKVLETFLLERLLLLGQKLERLGQTLELKLRLVWLAPDLEGSLLQFMAHVKAVCELGDLMHLVAQHRSVSLEVQSMVYGTIEDPGADPQQHLGTVLVAREEGGGWSFRDSASEVESSAFDIHCRMLKDTLAKDRAWLASS